MTGPQVAQVLEDARRGLLKSMAVRLSLLAAGVLAVLGIWSELLPGLGSGADMVMLVAALGGWVSLSISSAANGRLIGVAGGYAAASRFDLAEQALAAAASRFNLYRSIRLAALQNLAALSHGQGLFAQASLLCEFLVPLQGRLSPATARRTRMVLADSELMLGRLGQAYAQLQMLYAQPLSLAERMALLPTTCYYEASVGRWDYLCSMARPRSELAALMPATPAAATFACLALGFQQQAQPAKRDWLWQQATLLVDRDELVRRLPLLAELPADGVMALPWTAPRLA